MKASALDPERLHIYAALEPVRGALAEQREVADLLAAILDSACVTDVDRQLDLNEIASGLRWLVRRVQVNRQTAEFFVEQIRDVFQDDADRYRQLLQGREKTTRAHTTGGVQ